MAINLLLFLVAFKYKSDKLTDASYSTTFLVLVLLSLGLAQARNGYFLLLVAMVAIWAVRIGGFLLIRVIEKGKDGRFDGIREDFGKFAQFWLGQGASVWVLMLPVLLAFTHATPAHYSLITIVGFLIWLVGLIIESIADFQKKRFSDNPVNKNNWIDEGLWKKSRHPNYFGEMLIWIGIYLYVFDGLQGIEKIIALASPLLIVTLLRFISGVPILESGADKRWGQNAAYRRYKDRTNLLWPLSARK